MILGVIANSHPNTDSNNDATSFGWASHGNGVNGQVYRGGIDQGSIDGWSAWNSGDTAIFKLDLDNEHCLKMYHFRQKKIFRLTLPRNGLEWRLHLNMYTPQDCIRISIPTVDEAELLE